MKKIFTLLGFTLIVIVIIALLSSCKAATLEQEGFDRSEIAIAQSDEEVSVGDIAWKVTDSEYLGSLIPADTSGVALETVYGRFLSVDFSVENKSEEVAIIIDLKVIDSKGREYPICAEAYSYLGTDDACLLVEVYPGTTRTFQATFDVPLDAIDLILEVSDLGFPPQERAYIDLGI